MVAWSSASIEDTSMSVNRKGIVPAQRSTSCGHKLHCESRVGSAGSRISGAIGESIFTQQEETAAHAVQIQCGHHYVAYLE